MNLNPSISLNMYVMCMIYMSTEHMCMSSFCDWPLCHNVHTVVSGQPWVLVLNFYFIQEGKIALHSLTNKTHNWWRKVGMTVLEDKKSKMYSLKVYTLNENHG